MPIKRKTARGRTITWETVRELTAELSGAEESTSYGTPAFKVDGKLFTRLKEDGETIVVRIDISQRAMRLATNPKSFFVTEHYVPYPYMLVRLSSVGKRDLRELLTEAWRLVAKS